MLLCTLVPETPLQGSTGASPEPILVLGGALLRGESTAESRAAVQAGRPVDPDQQAGESGQRRSPAAKSVNLPIRGPGKAKLDTKSVISGLFET